MKLNRALAGLLSLLLFFTIACQKEISIELGKLPVIQPKPVDSSHTPPKDTATTPPPDTTAPAQPVLIAIQNPSFEESFKFWKKETAYRGKYGFRLDTSVAITGRLGLNFYAAQSTHWAGAPQETPWNGKIYQTVMGLKDGRYTFRIWAEAVGNGMYLWADGGAGEVKVLIKSDVYELNTLDFEVKGGVAKFGFICINADGPQEYAPYFHADDAELVKLP
jgi:hypothetical protein